MPKTTKNKKKVVKTKTKKTTKIKETKKTLIKISKIDNNFLKNVTITVYDKDFEINRIISSNEVDISENNWKIKNPITFKGNLSKKENEDINLYSNFDIKKINSLFKNLSSLNFYQLYKLKKNYNNLNYSYEEIDIHIKKLISFPLYLTIMSILSSIIMLNIKRNNSQIIYLFIGIFSSVTIYYVNILFQSLGKNGIIPPNLSIWMPIIILSTIISIGLIRINEK